jgi:hypothetical protein
VIVDNRRNDNARNDYYEPEPLPAPTYEYRRRPNERVYEAKVTSVRAVMGEPEHRVQMSAPPGRTIYVNRDGEPRQ